MLSMILLIMEGYGNDYIIFFLSLNSNVFIFCVVIILLKLYAKPLPLLPVALALLFYTRKYL